MRNRLKCAAIVAGLIGSLLLGAPSVYAADSSAPPPLSKAVAKPLKAAQDSMTAKNYDQAISSIKEAQAAPNKTPYESYVINELLAAAYVRTSPPNMTGAAQALEANLDSQYLAPATVATRLKLLTTIYYQTKDYAKAVDFGQQALKHGVTDTETYTLVADSLYLQQKYRDAAGVLQDLVSRAEQNGQKPDENNLKLLWQCYIKLNDEANIGKIIDKLVADYPKPEYWENAIQSLLHTKDQNERLQLNVYRLMAEVNILKLPSDYTDMAELAIVQGYPGEAVRILQQGLAKNVYTEQQAKDHAQRVLAAAQTKTKADEAQLPREEEEAGAAAAGDNLVQVGAAYLSYGQDDKAVSAINRGIAKGSLKYPEEAYLLLGVAELKAHNVAEADRAWDKVMGNPNYVRLAKLWQLHAKDTKA